MNCLKKDRTIISTLGPCGTCSEYATQHYICKEGLNGKIVLKNTFEESIDSLINYQSDLVIIPSAYYKLKEIMFNNYYSIRLIDVFKYKTPDLVIVQKDNNIKKVKKISTHESPSKLIKDYYPDTEVIIAKSNSEAAELFLHNDIDACLTTIFCAEKYSLNIQHNFKGIVMGWNVFENSTKNARKSIPANLPLPPSAQADIQAG